MTSPVIGSIDAIFKLLLIHNPDPEAVINVFVPIQIESGPEIETVGKPFIVTEFVGRELHPVAVSVKINVAVPAEIPVTCPELFTLAILLLLLVQTPPVDGDN